MKDTPRWDRAAMNDEFLGNEFRIDLQNTLVARAHDLDSAGRPSQRLHVLNDIMRGVGSKHFSFHPSGPRKQWISRCSFAPAYSPNSVVGRLLQHPHGSDAQRRPADG